MEITWGVPQGYTNGALLLLICLTNLVYLFTNANEYDKLCWWYEFLVKILTKIGFYVIFLLELVIWILSKFGNIQAHLPATVPFHVLTEERGLAESNIGSVYILIL